MFEFEQDLDNIDERSQFANAVCKLICAKVNFNFDKAFNEIENIYNHFDNHVRNVYELVDTEIPLFALYELLELGKDNWGFTDEEYQQALKNTREACKMYYCDSKFDF